MRIRNTLCCLSGLILAYMASGDLWNVLSKEKKLKEGRIWYVARAMLEALDHMHEQGKVHMDVKLENVLVFDEAWVKLCDFGLSRRLPPQAAHRLVAIACHPGTPMYMAPEMIFKRPYNFKVRSSTHQPHLRIAHHKCV